VKLVDSHCHLDDAKFDDDRDQVIERALTAGIDCMLAIGTGSGPPDIESAVRLAERYPFFYATVGVHPHDRRHAPLPRGHREGNVGHGAERAVVLREVLD